MVSSQYYDTSAQRARDAMLKHKDRLDFYPCVADTVFEASDFIWHKFISEILFRFSHKNHLTQSNAAACVHIMNRPVDYSTSTVGLGRHQCSVYAMPALISHASGFCGLYCTYGRATWGKSACTKLFIATLQI